MELADVSARLREQESLYDSLIAKKKQYESTRAVGSAAEFDGASGMDYQSESVAKVTQNVGILHRALDAVKQKMSIFSTETVRSSSAGAESLDKMRTSLSEQWSTWSSLGGMASSAMSGIKDGLLAATVNCEAFGAALRGAIPVIGIILTVLRGVVSVVGGIFSAFKKVASVIAGAVVSGAKKLASVLRSVGSHVLNYVTKPFQKAIAFVDKWKSKLLNVAFYRLVRSAIKAVTDGFKEGTKICTTSARWPTGSLPRQWTIWQAAHCI